MKSFPPVSFPELDCKIAREAWELAQERGGNTQDFSSCWQQGTRSSNHTFHSWTCSTLSTGGVLPCWNVRTLAVYELQTWKHCWHFRNRGQKRKN